MPRLSIIVPVYKVEKYLHKCIDSILNQTYTDFELILVDDGSPDNCGKICDEYALKDKRVRVIHKDNGGQSSARNLGLDKAKGEYIGFVDSDDYIDLNMYNKMMRFALENKLDIVCCDVVIVRGNKKKANSMYKKDKIFNGGECLLENLICHIDNSVWNKIYRKAIINDIRFTEKMVFEDVDWIYKIFYKSKSTGYLKKNLYYYIKREGSTISTSFNSKSRYDCFNAYKNRFEFAIEKKLTCINECRTLAVETALSTLTAFYANSEPKTSERYKYVSEFLQENANQVKDRLKLKQKILLWSYYNCELIYKLYAALSALSKKVK